MIDYDAISRAADMELVARSCGLAADSRHKALCPFHDDRRPSMQIYPDGYHCFVCGAHGDAIDLVQRLRGCTKHEAAEAVARICGGELVELDTTAVKRQTERRKFERMCDIALDLRQEAEFNIASLKARICDLTPYSAAWVYLYRQLNKWLMRHLVADNVALELKKIRG